MILRTENNELDIDMVVPIPRHVQKRIYELKSVLTFGRANSDHVLAYCAHHCADEVDWNGLDGLDT